ncbi:PEP-CTERM system TPR-repeat protein PrsT [Psychrosphaera ytuae]|uniref:PEP-CTERM system TPR-repeat protein PrsT n=1 Tax=Psychrosphaera ytuae TaxID=2820710 RepID=A0A975D9P0_9GAMM|nr:XrtA/PEP-CTERM system TPR-repeat protein PrsT [Psychrosphaera ytuae]QTH63107.1 PEP-CTERM system TPR-repeat protein PrsT [Psychrosphaera ytuae]
MNLKLTAVATALTLALAGCSGEDAESMYQSAQQDFSTQDYKTAVINLKNAIKENGTHPDYRALLGDVYFAQGQLQAAEKEYIKAIEYGGDEEALLAKLAGTLFYAADFQQVTEIELEDLDASPQNIAKLNVFKGMSASALNDRQAMLDYLELAQNTNQPSNYKDIATILVQNIDTPQKALESLSKLTIEDSESLALTHLVSGHLATRSDQIQQAVTHYQQFVDNKPNLLLGNLYLAVALLKNEQYEETIKTANKVLKVSQSQPFANFLVAQSQYQLKQHEQASLAAEKAVQNGYDNVNSRLVAALSAFNLQKYEVAFKHFNTIQQQLDASHPARQVMLATAIKLGSVEDIEQSLEDIEVSAIQPELLNAASLELFRSGKGEMAKGLLNQTSELDLNSSRALSQLGMLKISSGDDAGIKDLEAALALQPDSAPLYLTLGSAYLQSGKIDKAEALIEPFMKSQPSSVEAFNYAALVYMRSDRVKVAADYLTQAKQIDPSNKMSLLFDINQAFANKQFRQAFDIAISLLDKEPAYTPALKALSIAGLSLNLNSEVESRLQKAVDASDGFTQINLKATFHFIEKDYKAALQTLSSNTNLKEAPNQTWLLKSTLVRKLEGYEAGKNSYQEWVKAQPANVDAYLYLITYLETNFKSSEAFEAAKSAMTRFPNNTRIKLINAYYLSLNGESSKADQLLNSLTNTNTDPLYLLTKSQIEIANRRYESANELALQAYNAAPAFNTVRIRYALLKQTNSKSAAHQFAENHLTKYDQDFSSRLMLANEYMATTPTKAISHYEFLAKNTEANVVVLNNLAYLKLESGQLEEAKQYGEEAVKHSPDNPSVLDTMAMIYFKMNDLTQAKALINKAAQLAPDNQNIQLHLQQINMAG